MSHVLVLDRRGTRLDAEGNHLIVRHEEFDRPRSVPINQIEQVIASTGLDLNTNVLGKLASRQIGFTSIPNGRSDAAWFQIADTGGNVQRKIQQARAWLDSASCEVWSAWLVRDRIKQQARLLGRQAESNPAERFSSLKGSELLLKMGVTAVGRGRPELLGLEGAAAALYFAALAPHFAGEWQFKRRNRRPPRDPVNVLLSLSYTLMTSIAIRALLLNGLDPHLGFYHQPAYSRPSLACDLVELLRCHADEWVIELCRKQVLRPEHFTMQEDGCHMGKAGRGHYYRAWGAQAIGFGHLANRIALNWRRQLEASDEYRK